MRFTNIKIIAADSVECRQRSARGCGLQRGEQIATLKGAMPIRPVGIVSQRGADKTITVEFAGQFCVICRSGCSIEMGV